MENLRGTKAFTHVSFRIPIELRTSLEEEGKRRNTNVNALVNQILGRYMAFDRKADDERAVVLEKITFERILSQIPAEVLADIGGDLGPKIVKRLLAFYAIQPNLSSLVESYFEPMGSFSGWYHFRMSRTGPNPTLVFEHDNGPGWTAFLERYIAGVITSVLGIQPRIEANDSFVVVRF